jgi:hypothetical protein
MRIEYKNGDKTEIKSEEIENTRQRHYFWEIDNRDEDFEELDDYYERCHIEHQRQIDNELSQYLRKVIYKDGKWLCIESSREKYINMCKLFKIDENDVIGIWKEGDFHFR